MVVRYFNLKEDREEVSGGVIKVDSDAKLEERLQDATGLEGDYEFKYIKENIYELKSPNNEYSNTPIHFRGFTENIPCPVEKGPATILTLELLPDGEIKLKDVPKDKKVFLTEITKKEAKKLEEEANCWWLKRAYICS